MRFLFLMVACLFLQGCWVRLPSRGPDAIHAVVGKTATVEEPLYIYKDWDGATSLTQKEVAHADPKACIAIIQPGRKVKVVSIVSRRLPPGLAYYFVLRPLDPSQKFTFDHFCGVIPIEQLYPDSALTFDK